MSSKFKKKIRKILLTALAVVITLLIAFPIIWMLPAAFKTRGELFQIPNTFFPKTITLENFRKVFSVEVSGSTFLKSMAITFLVSCLSTFFSLFVNSFAGYVFARMEFRGKKILWGYFLFSMFVPGITIMLTSIRVVNILKMTDTIFVLFIPALANAYHIFFFRQFYYNIPSNIEEAATIDGASKIGVYFRIFLPMSTTPMIITGVGVFMASWNNFIWPTLTIYEQCRFGANNANNKNAQFHLCRRIRRGDCGNDNRIVCTYHNLCCFSKKNRRRYCFDRRKIKMV